jgi:(E)-4-hydroxy-3-methyl-but-2-enyl pyrophosphate reductase
MKIILSKYVGFCDGVQRAYNIALKISKDKKVKRPIFVLGSLVHNDDVVRKIEKMGIKKVHFDGNFSEIFNSRKKIGTLIVTAHGIGPDFYELAKKNKIDVIDTTCPKVTKVQRLAKIFSDKKYQVVIIGEKNHKEVKGIFEWSGENAKIVESIKDAENFKNRSGGKIAIISQTTQKRDLVKVITKRLKEKYPKMVKSFDTLCDTTNNRQKEIKIIAKKSDAVIVIGSSGSANSTHLWEIAKKINPKSYFIERAGDIKKSWLKDAGKIGISAGASTPPWIIEEVCKFIENKL